MLGKNSDAKEEVSGLQLHTVWVLHRLGIALGWIYLQDFTCNVTKTFSRLQSISSQENMSLIKNS